MTTELKPGIRYIVTRASVNGEFQVGDHVRLENNGDILSAEAEGWMPAEDVPKATEGWDVEIDKAWYEKRRAKLEQELAELESIDLLRKMRPLPQHEENQ